LLVVGVGVGNIEGIKLVLGFDVGSLFIDGGREMISATQNNLFTNKEAL
jgi:hypothetical protein